ncbi:MAG: hypothetical protein V9G10_08760 [Candidatus Nanopelagicales bacterium]
MAYVPFPVERLAYEAIVRMATGRPQDRGPAQARPPAARCPSRPCRAELYDRVGHGDIVMKPDIDAVRRRQGAVRRRHAPRTSTSSSTPPATTSRCPSWTASTTPEHNRMPLYLRVVPPDLPGLCFMGFIQTVGSGIPLYEYQAEWVGDIIDRRRADAGPRRRCSAWIDHDQKEMAQALLALRAAHDAGRLLALHPHDEGSPRQAQPAEPDRPVMRAVLADLSTPRYLWTAAAGKVKHDAGWGPGGSDAPYRRARTAAAQSRRLGADQA